MNIPSTLAVGRFVKPEVVATHFHLKPGDTVADFGAGAGYFLQTLSHAVGPEGAVYACEIQKNLIETLEGKIRADGLGNVHVLWCDIESPGGSKLTAGSVDVVVLVNTFFQFEDKAAALQEIKRVLRTGGNFFLIDWSESFGGLGPAPAHVVTATSAQALVEQTGFVYERSFDAGDHHYGLGFKNA